MIANLAGLLLMLALAALGVWLMTRAWRLRRQGLRWLALVPLALLTLILAAAAVFTGLGLYQFYAPRSLPVADLAVARSPERVARGEHIASFTCISCHAANMQLPLSGGEDQGKLSPIPVGILIPTNLTPGGPLRGWSDGEILRAVRRGVDRDGHPLITMGAMPFRNLSDDDLQAVIAYLRSQPAVQNDTPPDQPNLILALSAGAGLLPVPQAALGSTAPPKGATPEYGRYLVSVIGCTDCHGTSLDGGKGGGFSPAGPSLRAAAQWTPEQFIATIRSGVNPGGHALDPAKMHWPVYAHMDDEELRALHAYLRSLSATDQAHAK